MAQGLFTLKQVNQAIRQSAWPNLKTPAVEYLVVAGGGAGYQYGGGGAGGLLTGIVTVASGASYTVTVGGGGANTGQNSGTNSVFGSISATGGGAAGVAGGSGGGANDWTYQGNQGVSGQGNAGGAGGNGPYTGGGGGGAGTVGLKGATSNAGNGGAGIASAITGTVVTYSGGGGGGIYQGTTQASGGVGGGGTGGAWGSSPTYNATSGGGNTGGGGGGVYSPQTAGSGGSGIVIVSYPDVYAAATTTTGSPTVSTSGSGSLAFTGAATNYLSYGGQTPFVFGTGDFTIEFWIYFNSFAGAIIIDWRAGGSNGAYPTIYTNGTSLSYYVNGADAITSSTLSTSTWYHVAVSRTGTSTKMYLNGTQTGSTFTDTTNYLANATAPWIGSGGTSLNGYLTNVRAVKGVCVYTGTFTSPTSPLAATQPAGTNIAAITGTQTSLLLNSASGARLADSSTNSYVASVTGTVMAWNQLSPFATGSGYKNRVYTWTSSGSITF